MANTLTKDRIVTYDPGQAAEPEQQFRAPRPAWREEREITVTGRAPVTTNTVPPDSVPFEPYRQYAYIGPDGKITIVGSNRQIYMVVEPTRQTYPGGLTNYLASKKLMEGAASADAR